MHDESRHGVRVVDFNFTVPFGVALRAFRKSVGWTQLRLAVEVHRDHTYVSRWETGVLRPDADDLARLNAAFPLAAGDQALLRNAWLRSEGDDAATFTTVEGLRTSLRAAGTLRRLGQPRVAYELAARDGRAALERARSARMTESQLREILEVAGELLLEEVKGALDFATSEQVRGGLLAANGQEHRLVCAALDDRRARVRLAVAEEAFHYAVGDIAQAHRGAQLLFDELNIDEPEWLAETVRAGAINSGLLGDERGLAQAWDRFRGIEGDLSPELRRFALEGFIRGFSRALPDRAFEIVQEAYESLEGQGDASPVRRVQLVRSEGRLLSLVSGTVGDRETRRRVEQALATSRSLDLSKYIGELEALLGATA